MTNISRHTILLRFFLKFAQRLRKLCLVKINYWNISKVRKSQLLLFICIVQRAAPWTVALLKTKQNITN